LLLPNEQLLILNKKVGTLCNTLIQKLPFLLSCNPRRFRNPINGLQTTGAGFQVRKNIEDAELLKYFLFLSFPLQQAIAERIQIPLNQLLIYVEDCVRNDPFF